MPTETISPNASTVITRYAEIVKANGTDVVVALMASDSETWEDIACELCDVARDLGIDPADGLADELFTSAVRLALAAKL